MTGAELTPFAKPIASTLAKKFGSSVVERWTRYRATQFFQSFVEELAIEESSKSETKKVDEFLDSILEDEVRSEVLFDAYRRICFSTSKRLGPRIVGLLTARLIKSGLIASDEEEMVFKAAEVMGDAELVEFLKTFSDYYTKASTNPGKRAVLEDGDVVVDWCEEHRDSGWRASRESEIDVGPLDFNSALGSWAAKLASCGLLSSRVTHREESYEEDSERHIDQDGVITYYKTSITFLSPCTVLRDLLLRSLGPGTQPL